MNFAPSARRRGLMGMNVAATGQPVWSQAEWLERCRSGDALAWRWLYAKQFPVVYRLAIRMGVSERESADICQEVFLRVHRGLSRFRGDAQLASWIYTIALREINRVQRAGALRRALTAFIGRSEPDENARSPEQACQQAEAVRELAAVLDHLKPKQRAVFVLFELEELSLDEIAAVVGAGLETVKSRLRHARAEFERRRRQRSLVTLPGGRR
jgi:RNA polymerase sigma-70 factor, ECF subfamily